MSDTAIRAEDLSKLYRIGGKQEKYRTLRDTISGAASAPFRRIGAAFRRGGNGSDTDTTFWALKDVSFEVKRGEVMGVIGRNGAGKSTLLKILSRITEPSSGRAEIHGRVGSLLEVGTGFHPELTGRENIYLNGAILGIKRADIGRKFDEMVDFAEVEKFIDTPVKHYSSGMYLRLAFAVAAHMEPEILLIDEVLAVGDAQFQKKCLGKMGDVAKEGRTVLFVSHDMGAIGALCTKGLYMNSGQVEMSATIADCIHAYSTTATSYATFSRAVKPASAAYIDSVSIIGPSRLASGGTLDLQVDIYSYAEFDISLDWRLKNELGSAVAWGCPHVEQSLTKPLHPGLNTFALSIGPLPLFEGAYTISLDLDRPWIEYVDRAEDCIGFEVERRSADSSGHSVRANWNRGSVSLPFRWTSISPSE